MIRQEGHKICEAVNENRSAAIPHHRRQRHGGGAAFLLRLAGSAPPPPPFLRPPLRLDVRDTAPLSVPLPPPRSCFRALTRPRVAFPAAASTSGRTPPTKPSPAAAGCECLPTPRPSSPPSRVRFVPQSCSLHSAGTHALPAAFQVLRGGDGAVAGDRRGVLGNIVSPTS